MNHNYYPQFAELFSQFIQSLKEERKKILIQVHERPDGDCIGSQIALCRSLLDLGYQAIAVSADPVPNNLKGFIHDTPYIHCTAIPEDDYHVINVDCAAAKRVGRVLHDKHQKIFANIDHHQSNNHYGAHNFVQPDASATAEILAGLFIDHDWPIDTVSAQALYLGMATDTGQFCYGSTTAQVFELCQQLMKRGANPATAAQELYEHESKAKMALLQHFLASFQYPCDGRVCVGFLPDGIYKMTGATREDSEGLVEYARSLDKVEIGILLEENEGKIKGSFRAKDPIHRVDELAQHFNGGGHACAAGFNLNNQIEAFYPELVSHLEAHFKQLDTNSK